MDIVTVGIDLAKNVFALHGIDQSGKAVFIKPRVARSQLLEMVAHLPPCLIEPLPHDNALAPLFDFGSANLATGLSPTK